MIRRNEIARYGINARDVLDAVEVIGGKQVGQIVDGQKRYPLQARFQYADRDSHEDIGNVKVAHFQGRLIPLSQLAEFAPKKDHLRSAERMANVGSALKPTCAGGTWPASSKTHRPLYLER